MSRCQLLTYKPWMQLHQHEAYHSYGLANNHSRSKGQNATPSNIDEINVSNLITPMLKFKLKQWCQQE
jgi:hypothetical protein